MVTSLGHCAAARAACAVIQLPSVMMTPVSSATGMNSSGRSSPFSGWNQRTSASKQRILPVLRSTIGWKKIDSSSFWIAARSSLSISFLRTRSRVIDWSKKRSWFRPWTLAW